MYMKALFNEKKLLLILTIDILITVGLPFGLHGILLASGINNFLYPLLFAIFGVINALLSYLCGDLILIFYKRKNHLVTTPIPEDVTNKARRIRYPFIIATVIDILIFAIFALIFSLTGHWPLM